MPFDSSNTSIAERVLGVDPLLGAEAFKPAVENLMKREFSDEEFADFAMRHLELSLLSELGITDIPMSPDDRETVTLLESIQDILTRDVYHANTLVDWPSYQSMMQERGRKIGGTALLIGAISPFSARAFEVLAEDVYRADHAVVIDIEGSKAKKAHANFVLGSGTKLPFADESISYVHTNRLLHMLEVPGQRKTNQQRASKELFNEIGRVLIPGGQVFMQETIPRNGNSISYRGIKKFLTMINRGLSNSGMDEVSIQSAISPIGADFLFDPTRDFAKFTSAEMAGVVDVFAQKHPK